MPRPTPTHECSRCYVQGSLRGIRNHIRAVHGYDGVPHLITDEMKAARADRSKRHIPQDVIHKAERTADF